MAEKTSSNHGMNGMHLLIKSACDSMHRGTCDGHKTMPGTVEQTFGRLVAASTNIPNRDKLKELADDMLEDEHATREGPADAGQAFFGQFIDHDLTLDATTELGKSSGDPKAVRNFRTPRLDLDCVYGGGRDVSPHLFDGARIILGRREQDVDGNATKNVLDLQRNRKGRAIIGDPRNDENLFVSQVHGRLLIAQHNQIVDVASGDTSEKFEKARQEMIRWYHGKIVHEYLPQIVDATVLGPLAAQFRNGALDDTGQIKWQDAPDMPVEFSAAAYRFGHSMIRQSYKLNGKPGRENVPIFATPGSAVSLRGFSPVVEDNNIDMALFFGPSAQKARPIDTRLPRALHELPEEVVEGGERNLAFRNLDRGQITFALPSGEHMAECMGFTPIATDARITRLGLEGNTPLWYYILSEAEKLDGKLGSVGGTLVAGVILNLMIRGSSPLIETAHT